MCFLREDNPRNATRARAMPCMVFWRCYGLGLNTSLLILNWTWKFLLSSWFLNHALSLPIFVVDNCLLTYEFRAFWTPSPPTVICHGKLTAPLTQRDYNVNLDTASVVLNPNLVISPIYE